jgi:hypothetical protein
LKWKNSFRNIGKNDPEEGGKTCMKQSFVGTIERLGLNLKEDYFKITNLASGKKTSGQLQRT